MNVQRETDGLFSAMGYFRKDKALIITHNQTDTFKKDDKTIELVPAWKWMSE
jgi:predicted AAA+ superfamily ATPase